MSKTQSDLFVELSTEQAEQVNGGWSNSQLIGAMMGNASSGWWRRNFYAAARRRNYGAAIRVTDRYIGGLTRSLRRFGISVPNYRF